MDRRRGEINDIELSHLLKLPSNFMLTKGEQGRVRGLIEKRGWQSV
jgi:hypothetical protein